MWTVSRRGNVPPDIWWQSARVSLLVPELTPESHPAPPCPPPSHWCDHPSSASAVIAWGESYRVIMHNQIAFHNVVQLNLVSKYIWQQWWCHRKFTKWWCHRNSTHTFSPDLEKWHILMMCSECVLWIFQKSSNSFWLSFTSINISPTDDVIARRSSDAGAWLCWSFKLVRNWSILSSDSANKFIIFSFNPSSSCISRSASLTVDGILKVPSPFLVSGSRPIVFLWRWTILS